MANQAELPAGWRISGYGPLGEGVEATGPEGQRVIAPTEAELAKAIRIHGIVRIEEK